MTTEAKLIGTGGRLNRDAQVGEEDGLPWLHDGSEDLPEPLPNRVVPKGQDPVVLSPASSGRPGSTRKETVSTILELVGIVTLSTGFFMISPALGFITSGLAMVLLGVATSDFGK